MDDNNRNVIARRNFELDGREGAVVLTVFAPKLYDNGRDWCCTYRVEGLPGRADRRAGGVDGVQALELALKNMAMFLYSSPEAREGRLTFLKQGRGDLGLPMPDGFDAWYRDVAPEA